MEKLDKRVMQRELILLAGKKDMKFLQQRKQKGDATMIISNCNSLTHHVLSPALGSTTVKIQCLHYLRKEQSL